MNDTRTFDPGRFERVCGFYLPRVLRACLIGGITVAALYLVGLLGAATDSFKIMTLATMGVSYTIYLMPLAFAGRDRSLEMQLPASAAEKYAFLVGYTILLGPLYITALWYALNLLGYAATGIFAMKTYLTMATEITSVTSLQGDIPSLPLNQLLRYANDVPAALVCLYGVLSVRTRRVAKAVGYVLGFQFILMLVGGILGVIAGLRAVHEHPGKPEPEEIVQAVTRDMLVTSVVVAAVFTVALLVMIWRRVKYNQI